jgi:hypothetical protein
VKLNRDHFDRGFESELDRRSEQEPREPVIHSKRGARFAGYTSCPFCFFPRVPVTYQGQLRSGQKLYEVATHSPGAGSRRAGKPICNGTGKRLELLVDGTWRHS